MNRQDRKHLRRTLSKSHACYILITCDEPAADGTMQIEMTYEGDADVAAFMLQGAQSYIDDCEACACNPKPSKVESIHPQAS